VPLQSVHVDVLVARGVAEHCLTHTYVNTGPTAIETHYLFPLPDTAGVSGFSATFASGRKVHGIIKERNEAKQIYTEAIQSGNRAALLEAHRPDIFQASIGNLGPGEKVIVALSYCCELVVESDALRLTIPSHVAPRYTPHANSGADNDTLLAALTSNITMKQATFSADVRWETGNGSIDTLESPTHPSLITECSHEPGQATAKLEGSTLDADLVVTLKPKDLFQPVVMLEECEVLGPATQALMLSFVPKFELPMIEKPNVVFVVDCSGSMRGHRIRQAKAALQICLQSLPPGSRFNIVKFGSDFSAMSSSGSVPYSDEALGQGLLYIQHLEADMGGTEIINPLRFALASHNSDSGYSKQVILLTDGQVANEQNVVDFVRGKGNRIFSLGIGSGVSTFLVKGLARATEGHAAFVQDGEDLEPVCASMFKKALTPAISNLKISWPNLVDDEFVVLEAPPEDTATADIDSWFNSDGSSGVANKPLSFFDPQQRDPAAYRPRVNPVDAILGCKKVQQAPRRPPAVFADSHFCAFALYPGGVDPTGEIVVSGESPVGEVKLQMPVPRVPVKRKQPLLHRMAARALIRDIEEGDAVNFAFGGDSKRLSLGFSVLCQKTGFVVVDKDDGKEIASQELARPADPLAQAKMQSAHKPPQFASPVTSAFYPGGPRAQARMRPPTAITNAISWRAEGIQHKKNEVFLDFEERLNYLMSADGSVLGSKVKGSLRMKSYLSGMPELKLVLNNKLSSKIDTPVGPHVGGSFENCRFHQCVRLLDFEVDQTMRFMPPDGEFELMSYEYSGFAKPPVQVKTAVTSSSGQREYQVQLQSLLTSAVVVADLEINVPLPAHAQSPYFKVSGGIATYCAETRMIVWQVKRLEEHCDLNLTATFGLPPQHRISFADTGNNAPCISMRFKIPGYLASKCRANFLKIIEKSGYQAAQHTRYCTVGEQCQHRLLY